MKIKIRRTLIAQIAISFIVFLLAMMLTTQIKTVSKSEEMSGFIRENELKDSWLKMKTDYDKLNNKYEELQKVVEEYQTNSSTNDKMIANMKSELDKASLLAGITDVKGEGITIKLNDSTNNSLNVDRELLIIHDSDVASIVNELKIAGAEAISVNDNRIVSVSGIRCVGPVIQVNGKPIATPITIKAIGNSQYLESALTIKDGIIDNLKKFGIGVEINREKELLINKYNGIFDVEKAKTVK